MKKVAVGLSGGVDSSVAAAMLVAQGYEVTGVYIEAYNEPGCRTNQDKKDALKVALQLGIAFVSLDLRKEYKEKVIEYFFAEYEAGRTPNPDMVCNREIKFGIFWEWGINNDFDLIATGHYARIIDGRLQRAVDLTKDQSYFLAQVSPEKLKHVLFPLGKFSKIEVRHKAKELELVTANKPDSMGICFVGEVDVAKMLVERLGEKKGEVLIDGVVVGAHKGIWTATVGQKVGQEILLYSRVLKMIGLDTTKMPALFVTAKDKERNQIMIGAREQCYRGKWEVTGLEWVVDGDRIDEWRGEGKLFVRIRNLGELSLVKNLKKTTDTTLEIEVGEAIFAPAGGQIAVFYARSNAIIGDEIVVGVGEIFT
ncbi:MAG: tRNA 2-thiouridine(34) synthase MnmA [bacterium]